MEGDVEKEELNDWVLVETGLLFEHLHLVREKERKKTKENKI